MRLFYPVRDRIIVRRLEEPENEQTEAGLFLPGTARNSLIRGSVVAVGAGGAHEQSSPPDVMIGDVVYYPEQVGVDVKLYGTTYRVLQYDQVFLFDAAEEVGIGIPLMIAERPGDQRGDIE